MGLFKTKKQSSSPSPAPPQEDSEGNNGVQKKKKKFPFLRQGKQHQHQVLADVDDSKTNNNNLHPAKGNATDYQQLQQRDSHPEIHEEEECEDLGDIPRSISTPSRDDGMMLPRLPSTPKEGGGDDERGGDGVEEEEEDSIGSPCETMFKNQKQSATAAAAAGGANTQEDTKAAAAKRTKTIANLTSILSNSTPSLDHLHHYISALSPSISPDPSGDLPSRALRCLFTLSEHSSHKAQRIAMVKGVASIANGGDDVATPPTKTSLIPTLLTFLARCPRDSSEQYLSLLVLNNLSIPTENKRPIALEYGGAKILGRLLCHDPGCHLLVIILVNLTFGDGGLNRDLLCMSGTSVRRTQIHGVVVGSDEEEEEEEVEALSPGVVKAKNFFSCGGDVQLVDSLGYALLVREGLTFCSIVAYLASLTTEQLNNLGPIPLTSSEEDGSIPYNPRKLLSTLFSMLGTKLGIRYRKKSSTTTTLFVGVSEEDDASTNNDYELPLLALENEDDCPFPETARWCLGALKNLTRPEKLSRTSCILGDTASNMDEEEVAGVTATTTDASAIATQAILDANILPLLLRILKNKQESKTTSGCYYNWTSNSAQDAALYTLMHMTSVPQVRRVLREEYGDCVDVLVSILNYGKVIDERLLKHVMAPIKNSSNGDDDKEKGCVELGQSSLQCLKARMALSYLLLSNEKNLNSMSKFGSATILAEHETHTFLELLSHTLQGRAKEGPSGGGYSAATFTIKGVLHSIKCILSEPRNRELFASTTNECRLNTLLLKAIARYSLLSTDNVKESSATKEILDAEAVEHAVISLYWMTLYGMDEAVVGFSSSPRRKHQGGSAFLPMTFGDYGKMEAKSVLIKVLTAYLNKKDGISHKGRHAANQVLFRVNYLKFEGSVADLTYPGKSFPSKTDFDMDDKLLAALKSVSGGAVQTNEGVKPKEYIFDRAIARHMKEGPGSNVFSSGEEAAGTGSKVFYSSALIAAEELAAQQQPSAAAEPINTIDVANNIAYYADGLDVYYGFVWKWEDGNGDLIERIYSAAETEDQLQLEENEKEEAANDLKRRSGPYSPPRKGFLGRLKIPTVTVDDLGRLHFATVAADDNEPFSIFGLRCGAPVCGKGY
ncbi:hypothetical protein ACHAXR_012564 [Thalassiosira sp. AJA248-18]